MLNVPHLRRQSNIGRASNPMCANPHESTSILQMQVRIRSSRLFGSRFVGKAAVFRLKSRRSACLVFVIVVQVPR